MQAINASHDKTRLTGSCTQDEASSDVKFSLLSKENLVARLFADSLVIKRRQINLLCLARL